MKPWKMSGETATNKMAEPIDRILSEDNRAAGILEALGCHIASAENAINAGRAREALFTLAQLREVCAETARTLRARGRIQEQIERLTEAKGENQC